MEKVQNQQLSLLVHLANVDDDFADVEQDLIKSIGQDYGMEKATIDQLIEKPEEVDAFEAFSLEQKFQSVYDCIRLMLVDGVIHKQEILFCQSLVDSLGFSREVLQLITDNTDEPEKARKTAFQLGYC